MSKKNMNNIEIPEKIEIPKEEVAELMLQNMERRVETMKKLVEEKDNSGKLEKIITITEISRYAIDDTKSLLESIKGTTDSIKELIKTVGEYDIKMKELDIEMTKIVNEYSLKVERFREINKTVRSQVEAVKEFAQKLIDFAISKNFSDDKEKDFEKKMEIVDRATSVINNATAILEKLITS